MEEVCAALQTRATGACAASFQSRPAERAECSYALQKLQEENRELREAYEQELRANEAMRMQLIALSQDLERYERKVQVGPRAVPFDGSSSQ